jgi:hypothetical protein
MSQWENVSGTAALEEPRRNRFFYGKLLDEIHLQLEQKYFNQKRWMLNRLGLGRGVLCGLDVTVSGKTVCISPGVAIDGEGREIVVPQALQVDPWQLSDGTIAGQISLDHNVEHDVYICIVYRECPTDYVPVLVTDCDSDNQQAPSIIAERFCVLVKEITESNPAPPLPPTVGEGFCDWLSEDDKRKAICEALSERQCATGSQSDCAVLAQLNLSVDDQITISKCDQRPIVYSNPELFEMIMCLSEQSGTGMPGPAGPPGPPGPGIDIVSVTELPCEESPTAGVVGDSPNRTLNLGIPRGCDGAPGNDGAGISKVEVTPLSCEQPPTATLSPDNNNPPNQILTLGLPGCCDSSLTKIIQTNWIHDGEMTWFDFLTKGPQVNFSDEVTLKPQIDQGWFLVSLEFSGGERGSPTNVIEVLIWLIFSMIWSPGSIHVRRVDSQNIRVTSEMDPTTQAVVHFASFLPSPITLLFAYVVSYLAPGVEILARIVVKCDFLRDNEDRPVDGNHLRGQLPSGDGRDGGEFESWFKLPQPTLDDLTHHGISVGSTSKRASRRAKVAGIDIEHLRKVIPGFAELEKLLKNGG